MLTDQDIVSSFIKESVVESLFDANGNIIELDLSNLKKSQLPPEIFQFAKLQSLRLNSTLITYLPPEIGQLTQLQKLQIYHTPLAQLPPEIGQLISLKELLLHGNKLIDLPPEIGKLTNLEEMLLGGNKLHQLPPEFSQLINLRRLALHNNQLTQFPQAILQLSKLTALFLHGNELTQIPSEISQLKYLWDFSFGNNSLTELPPEIFQLKGLRSLHIQGSQLTQLSSASDHQLTNLRTLWIEGIHSTQIPSGVFQLSHLHSLRADRILITNISSEIGQLANLRELYLNNNQLTQLPAEIGQLANLRELYLNNNQLTQLPAEIGQLTNLQELHLDNNQLTQLPAEIGQLTNLRKLYLNNNQLTQLPAEIGQLTNLQELYLNNNQLTQLPAEIGQLTNLKTLDLNNNIFLLTPPPEIIAQGTKAILTFLQELSYASLKRYEAKLILVGEGGTGKSSLLRALHGKTFIESLNTTHGIELGILNLPHPTFDSVSLSLNTWDFGGQDIYRATHQFFLTKRSLYLVVWNARTEATQGKLDYWLKTIHVLAPDALILLVATHIDERIPDLNVPQYLTTYPQIIDVLQISSKTGDGIPDLKQKLAKYASTLPLMGQPWPISWIEVEKALVAKPNHHISATTYMDICMTKGVQAEMAQGTLGSYLHDLGKILYFRDDPILREIVVLKPNWVTKAISLILEDTKTISANGILEHTDLARIWATDEQGNSYSASLHQVFLRLMERFELCYQINPLLPGGYSTHSLIPQLLPHQPPTLLPGWIPEDVARGQMHVTMTYRLDFVPAGIMSWLIVRTHRYTQNFHWRDGTVLSYQEHFARVEMFSMLGELKVEVWGIEPHTFFVIIKDTIDLILSRFEGLRIRQEVPCNCHLKTGITQSCTEVYRYEEDLIRRLRRGKQVLDCPASGEDVSILSLLYGIHISTTPQVIATIEQGQQDIIRHLNTIQYKEDLLLYNDNVLLQRVNQLCEWNVRQFTRLWNLEMRKMETECPNSFFLVPSSTTPFNIKNWISHEYKLFLMCQHPLGPHCILNSKGYEFRQPKEQWVKLSPWLKHLINFLKFSIPIAGTALGVVLSEDTFKQLDKQIQLLEKIIEDMPDIGESDPTSLARRGNPAGQEQDIGPSLRVLHTFLNDADPHKYWDGLHKVVTPDGNIFWLCEEHAHPYQIQPLQL